MSDPIEDRHFVEIERAYTFQTSCINALLIGIRAAPVMGMDPAFGTEVVVRHFSIESINRQHVLPGLD